METYFASKLRSDWQGRLWNEAESFEADSDQIDLWLNRKLTRKKEKYIVPNLDIIARVSILIAFFLMSIFFCFSINTKKQKKTKTNKKTPKSINTNLTFNPFNLIRVLTFCTIQMDNIGFTQQYLSNNIYLKSSMWLSLPGSGDIVVCRIEKNSSPCVIYI